MTIQVFAFGDRKVRTAGTHEAPLFCAGDTCEVLGYRDVSQACERLDQDDVVQLGAEKGSQRVLYVGANANMYVTESGLFALILGSNKPEAKVFKKWVTAEVLPEIRRRGYYDALEVANRKKTELLLAECFPNLPSKSAPIFRDLIASLLRVRGEDGPGNPPWARVLASMIYNWAIRVEGQQAFRRARNPHPNGSATDHSMFGEVSQEAVKRVAQAGCDYAKISLSWEDWKSKMATLFGGALQLTFEDNVRLLALASKQPKKKKGAA